MGNGASSIGDLFFPDNPSRRRRAQELSDQINAFGEEFKQLKAQREQKIDSIRGKLDGLMKSRGFATTAQLESHVRSIIDGQALRDYDNLKQALDLNDKIQGIIFDAISIVGAASGVILGVGVLAGIVTGGAALAALGVVGEILAVVAIVIIVFGVIEGAVERDRLRDAINKLWPQRARIKQAVEQMRVIVNWVDALDIWLNNPTTNNPATLDALLNGSFEPAYRAWTIDHTCDVLQAQDAQNGSWTSEDPGRDSLPNLSELFAGAVSEVMLATAAADVGVEEAAEPQGMVAEKREEAPVAELIIHGAGGVQGHHEENFKVKYRRLLAKNECVVEMDGELMKITATEANEEHPKLESTLFKIEPFEEAETKDPAANGTHMVAAKAASKMSRVGRRFAPMDSCSIRVVSCSTR